ncbi:MAG: transporter substrate-binding domain-containing protein [Anaerovoracaceae bacterium]
MKRIISVALAMVLVVSLASCGKEKQGMTINEDKLIVGMELAYPPFETKDKAGDPIGISPDFAKAFGEYIGKEVEIVNTSWDGLIPSLETNKVDMVMSSMTITDERKDTVDFSEPYANAMLAFLLNKNTDVKNVKELNKKGKVIAVKTGSTGALFADKNLSNAKIVKLADESACVTEVAQGKADGFIYDQLTIYRNNQRNENSTKTLFIKEQKPEQWGVAVKKGNKELQSKLNEFIAKYTKDGGFDKLTDKYLKKEKAAFEAKGFKWFFDIK